MTRITNAEQVLLLLRSHLERAKRSDRARTEKKSTRPGPLSRAGELTKVSGLGEAEIARAVIAGLLAEEFGAELAVEPRFQAMVDEVQQIIDRDEGGRALIKQAIAQIAAETD